MSNLSKELAKWVIETKYEDLPQAVAHEAKRALLDSIGCALAGLICEKGKIPVMLARRLGGPPEASIIGLGDKVSCVSAALANGELINALDYDIISAGVGHCTPFVLPPVLAVAESANATGKELIVATALAHEIGQRMSTALHPSREPVPDASGKMQTQWAGSSGTSQCIFGGAAGVGKILKLDHTKLNYALGLAGHLCPMRTWTKWQKTSPSTMTKYGSAGWISATGVTAALLAEMGYVGDESVFEGDYGYWRFAGSTVWKPENVRNKLGEEWLFLSTSYKLYPLCYCMHSGLEAFTKIIEKNNLMPEDIESVKLFSDALSQEPLWHNRNLVTNVDAQFSVAYVFAVAAHRVKIGPEWQAWETMTDPRIRAFMKKVQEQELVPDYYDQIAKSTKEGKPYRPGIVEVVAKGKKFREEVRYCKGSSLSDKAATDEELVEKFTNNAYRILPRAKVGKAAEVLMNLEKEKDVSEVMKLVTL